MPSPALDSEARERLRADLEALDCVRRAVVDADPLRVYIVCDRTESPTDMLVASVLARAGISGGDAEVHLAYLTPAEQRRRVRFVAARMTTPRSGRAAAEVELEWGGQAHSERAEGEASPPLELRLAAAATLKALEGILRGRVRFSLLGIKSFRAFDTDVVVVLMRTDHGPPLVGASLASGDPYRAAALAVLNATNRVLGNYLSNSHD
ncbi:MAG: hypothetical protein KY444_11675 [Gemmatimonadetes bacterium]|nr:hypothetical protein [Gemmatimonadota bacterium]